MKTSLPTPDLPRDVPPARTLGELFEAMACCTRCELAAARTRVVAGTGPADARVMLIGEGPGAREDESGVPFVGAAGRLLDTMLEHALLRREDVFITNVVGCRPPANRTPKPGEVIAHAPWLEEQIRLVAPRIIGTLGRSALNYFMPKASITLLHGQPRTIERNGSSLSLLPFYHPAAALRFRSLIPVLEADFRVLRALVASLP